VFDGRDPQLMTGCIGGIKQVAGCIIV
jgi:hypothetical protein